MRRAFVHHSHACCYVTGASTARIAPALAAMSFGIALFIATGFAWPSVIHNATHDMRHSLGLPCH